MYLVKEKSTTGVPIILQYLCQYIVFYTAEIGESEFWISQGENANKNKKGRKPSTSTLPH